MSIPKLRFLTLLDHKVELSGGPFEPLTPDTLNPGFWRKDGSAILNSTLQSRIDSLLNANPDLKKIKFAVADLTGSSNPRFAGNRNASASGTMMTALSSGGSLLKIAPMFAAFQLQHDLNAIAAADPSIKSDRDLFKAARTVWAASHKKQPGQAVEKLTRQLSLQGNRFLLHGRRNIPVPFGNWNPKARNPARDASPNLSLMFDVDTKSSPLTVKFKRSADTARTIKDFKANRVSLEDVPFFERMLLMVDASDNDAARSCVLDVGYLFICSSLFAAGLFNPSRGGGLWEGGNHKPTGIKKSDSDETKRKKRKRAGPKFRGAPMDRTGSWNGASAAGAVTFMTLLEQRKLVSAAACGKMLFLLDKDKRDPASPSEGFYGSGDFMLARSFVLHSHLGMGPGDPNVFAVHSKIGIAGGSVTRRSDVALIDRKVPAPANRRIRYVLSYVGSARAEFKLADDLIKEVEKVIVSINP